jgi:N-acetylglucosamine-6-phosphate deacetylase
MNNMIIKNALVWGEIKNICIKEGKIHSFPEEVDCFDIDAGGKRIIPGLIDVHSHGCIGMDTMDADFEAMCRFYAENGTTTWYPTTMTMGYDDLLSVCNAKTDYPGAQIYGFHFEGPYIAEKYKGAQNPEFIKDPSPEDFSKFSRVKMITVAPERPGGIDFIKAVTPDCVVALGHTECTYEQAIDAINAGATCLTHTYNAMPGLHHRNPGPIGAAVEKQIYAQLITDGIHIARAMVLATYKMFGRERMVIISDSIRPAGLPDGKYESGGLAVELSGGVARLLDGTIAGSASTLWKCVLKATEFGIPFEDAVYMASATPAEMMGLNKGHIKEGYDADLLILNDDNTIDKVIISGKEFE